MSKSIRINPNTKYYPPRILDKLEFARSYPCTLVEAPSGFGKTTLLEYFFDELIPPPFPGTPMISSLTNPCISGGRSAFVLARWTRSAAAV